MGQREQRRYIRIATVLPVEFFVTDGAGKRITPWLQGFTQDISRGGICLVVNDLWWGFWDKCSSPSGFLELKINLALGKAFFVKARITWRAQSTNKDFTQYKLGLEFTQEHKGSLQSLFRFALLKYYIPRVTTALVAVLALAAIFLTAKTTALIKENRKLVSDYVGVIEQGSSLESALTLERGRDENFDRRRQTMMQAIAGLEEDLANARREYQAQQSAPEETTARLKEKIARLEQELSARKKESAFFEERFKERALSAQALEKKVVTLQAARAGFSQKIIQGFYRWIQNRRDLVRGLVISFEGDRNLEKVCFTYDQALASVVFILMDDTDSAAKIFDFYMTQTGRTEHIYNAYYSSGEPAEFISHSGPNAWIGIAVLNYTKKTGDRQYLAIAQKVASFLSSMMDSEGGIRGGPNDPWFSTEHNLDAYAFFSLYYQVNGDPAHKLAADKIRNWISKYAYTSYGPPVSRGKGDATIATDTYAWSVSTFGPETLLSLNMNPEGILDFAIQSCEVEAVFKRAEGEVTLRGFDFAKFKNMARGGVVSGEWTAQMILSFEIMADYYKESDPVRYRKYFDRALFYYNELQKMIISSPSRVGREDPCLPYASSADVDTGHGWRTPRGDSTGSLASTAYFLIAYAGYNPFTAEHLAVSLKEAYEGRSRSAAAGADKN